MCLSNQNMIHSAKECNQNKVAYVLKKCAINGHFLRKKFVWIQLLWIGNKFKRNIYKVFSQQIGK